MFLSYFLFAFCSYAARTDVMFGKISSIAILFALAPLHALAKTCFARDGSRADDTYQPCIAVDGVESMCCSLNSTTPDTCNPNGLCLSSANSKYVPNYWRCFCTDETWDSPNCLSKTICDKSVSRPGQRLIFMLLSGFESILTDLPLQALIYIVRNIGLWTVF